MSHAARSIMIERYSNQSLLNQHLDVYRAAGK